MQKEDQKQTKIAKKSAKQTKSAKEDHTSNTAIVTACVTVHAWHTDHHSFVSLLCALICVHYFTIVRA